jgi:PAS domain S-box-containing protein
VPESVVDEHQRLRRTMRDLVALSTLPAAWTGVAPENIASSLADFLLDTLALDLIVVRVAGPNGGRPVEVVRSHHRPRLAEQDLASAVGPLLSAASGTSHGSTLTDPFGSDTLQVAVTRFGVGDEQGLLVAACRRTEFPTEEDRLIFGVGANQAAVVLHRERIQAQLLQSERELADFFENASVGLHWVGPDGTILRANQAELDMLGYRREDYVGRPIADFHVDEAVIGDILERLGAGERLVEYPAQLRCRDGSIKEVLIDSSVLWRDGRFVHTRCFTRDVTERKRAELVLQESEQRFRQLADAMPHIVWTATPDGNIDYLNRRWTEVTGMPETAGNVAWGPLLHPEDAPRATVVWERALLSGTPFEMEIRLLSRPEGLYRWHLIRTVPVHDDAGHVSRWFGTATDITEQKRAEESSRYLANASAELSHVVDYQSTLQKITALAVPYFADWSAVDVSEHGALRRLAVAHQDPVKVAVAHELMREYPPDPASPMGPHAVLRSGRPELISVITEEQLVRGAKDSRHLDLIGSLGLKSYICVPIVVAGRPFGVLTFATAESGRTYLKADLALAVELAHRAAVAIENTQLYHTLRDSDRRKDEFLATLTHELRNPLAPIRNALAILGMPRADAETLAHARAVLGRQVDHMVRLVDDLLDVSRVVSGKIELRAEPFELATAVAHAVETVQPLIDAQGHQLSISLPSESLLLRADRMRISQVIGNLLTNAARYTPAGGRISVTADRQGNMAVLTVRDNGVGIEPSMLTRIFDLFVQAQHAGTQGGLGIGLTLVKTLVELHDGTIEAVSGGPGKGAEFVVRLPVVQQAAGAISQADSAPALMAPSGRRVLVVDDNQDAASSLATLLQLQGHDVRVAFSGLAALAIVQNYTPHVVFLDIGMPDMDGYEVARRLRQRAGFDTVVMAALTGWGQQADRRRTSAAGFDHHFVKPPDPRALERLLSEVPSL